MAKCTQIKVDLAPCYIKRRVHPEVYAYKRGEITKPQLDFIRKARRLGFEIDFGIKYRSIDEMISGKMKFNTEVTIRKTLTKVSKVK
jgi:hypothetical protein